MNQPSNDMPSREAPRMILAPGSKLRAPRAKRSPDSAKPNPGQDLVPKLGKLSAAILRYGAPLLDRLDERDDVALWRDVMKMIITLWNASVVEQSCGDESVLGEVRAGIEKTMPLELLPLVETLVRRRQLFADDLRFVGSWTLREVSGSEVTLQCEAVLLR